MDTSKLGQGTTEKMTVFITSERGTKEYCDLDEKSGAFTLRKVMGRDFPGYFGFIPRTRSADTGPLEAMVMTVEDLRQGMAVHVRPIGLGRLKGGLTEEIVIAVLCGDEVVKTQDLLSLNEEELEELGKFLGELKGKEFQSFFGPDNAKRAFERAVELYRERNQ